MEEKEYQKDFWERADKHEIAAKIKISSTLKPFYSIIKDIYEAGILVATLQKDRVETSSKPLDQLVSGLLLKQILTDLRVIWNLVSSGYTLQAATIAATHFEMTISLQYIIGNEERAKQFLVNNDGDLPWKIIDLCKFVSKKEQKAYISQGKPYTQEEYELNWRALYVDYIWLCKIKHPSMQSLLHGSSSTKLKNGNYVIMSFPDITESDLPTKTNILVSVTYHTYSAILEFFESIKEESEKSTKNYIEFQKRIKDYPERLKVVWDNFSVHPLAVNLIDNKLYKECIYYSELVHKQNSKQ
jgi:hypothetical protein